MYLDLRVHPSRHTHTLSPSLPPSLLLPLSLSPHTHTLTLSLYHTTQLLYLDLRVHPSRQQQVSRAREQSDGSDAPCVAHPRVDMLLWRVALWRRFVAAKVDIQVLSDVEVGATQVVQRIIN